MNKVLIIILLFLMIAIGKKRGIKVFITIIFNFILLILSFCFLSLGLSIYLVSFISCLLFSVMVLFFMNGDNLKTRASFLSVLVVFSLVVGCLILMTNLCRLGGFGYEEFEEINMFSYDIHFSMSSLYTGLVLLGLTGAIVDSSIAISSSLYEVSIQNPNLTRKELFQSGLTIGKDILGTTTNTLLFAYLGEFMTLIIWFMMLSYSSSNIINSKVFASEYVKILFSAIGCIIMIPITSIITSIFLKKNFSEAK